MSFLNTLINNLSDQALGEELQDRVDLVQHKIKFMDKIPVACLDRENRPNAALNQIIEAAGGILEEDVMQAKVVMYYEANTGMVELMGIVPALLNQEWPSVAYNRVYLVENDELASGTATVMVSALEDIAEMLYPGYFIFGNEGKTWTGFGV